MTSEQFRKEINNVHGTGKTSSIRSDNSEAKVLRQAVCALPSLPIDSQNFVFPGTFGLGVKIFGKSQADVDNIGKGIMDGLQGTAFGNDRDCKEIEAGFCRGEYL